jgi:dolichyl-phosphate beta-glucosyltransferase
MSTAASGVTPDGSGLPNRTLALSVVVPAYNEAARLPRTLDATVEWLEAHGAPYELLIVDDGSTDDTAAVAESWAVSHAHTTGSLRVLSYRGNRGKGYAVRFGVLRAAGERVLFMDADLATPIEELDLLGAAIDHGAAYAIGSRDVRGSRLEVRQPWYREASGRLFNKVIQVLATPGIHDTQCGFKLLTRFAAQEIFSRCTLDGFSFDVEAVYIARRLGLPIVEVPVRWRHQEGAAAFATKSAYLRHGIRMLSDAGRVRRMHRGLKPSAAGAASIAAAGVTLGIPPPQ